LEEIRSSGSSLEKREYGRGDPMRRPLDTLYPQKLALTSPTYGGRSVGIIHLRAKTTEFVCLFFVVSDICLLKKSSFLRAVGSSRTARPILTHYVMIKIHIRNHEAQ
jgi:hypothetical protein